MKTPILFSLCLISSVVVAENWPQFRGDTGRGHSSQETPTSWDESSILWKVGLGGEGQSSPVIWGDRIFITSASSDGTERHTLCLSAETGEELWKETVASDDPEEAHKMNSRATPSCATNGEYVVSFFGSAGMHCYDFAGELQWSLDLGSFPGSWGVAASPIIVGGKVIQNCDCEGESRLLAVALETGEIIWETPREAKPRGGWSTPVQIENGGKREIVLNGEFGVRGYDPDSGEELWFAKGFNGRGAPIPDWDGEKLYVVNGKPGDVYSVRPGGEMVWHAARKGGRDLPSPIVVGDLLLVSSMSGILSSYDTATGEIHFVERLASESGIEIAGPPLAANGLTYWQTVHGGDVVVVRPGKELDIVAVNSLGEGAKDEIFRASLVPIDGKVLIRSEEFLYCVGE